MDGLRAPGGAGALGSDAFRLHSRRTIADELGSLGQGQRLDLGEVASCLLAVGVLRILVASIYSAARVDAV